jgi:hypothetical protein
MELTYDWRSFQAVFYPQKRALSASQHGSTLFAVVEKNSVISIYGDGEDFSDYLGASVQSLRGALNGRELVLLEREDVDQWMNQAVSLSHLHEQVEFFRKSVSPKLESKVRANLKKQTCLSERHFLLDALLGKWNKVLPSAFGVFIRLEKAQSGYVVPQQLTEILGNRCKEYVDEEQDILVLIRAGKIEAFYEPDLNPMGAERRNVCADVVKYLSEKHSVPIQGISLPYIEWILWNHDDRPWRQFAGCLKSRTAKLAPLRWQSTALVGLRAATEFGYAGSEAKT